MDVKQDVALAEAIADARARGFPHPVTIPKANIERVVSRIAGPRDATGRVISAGAYWLAQRGLVEERDWVEIQVGRITVAFRDERAAIEFKLRWG